MGAKVQHFSCVSKFCPSIWGVFQNNFIEFARIVIHAPQFRNYQPSKITFRRWLDSAGLSCLVDLGMTDDK
jgi:hypothetical protein